MTLRRLRAPAGALSEPLITAAGLPFALAVGWAVVNQPTLAILAAGAFAGLLLLVNAHARLLFVVFGAIAVFGTTDELTPTKFLFLAGLGPAIVGAYMHARDQAGTAAYAAIKPLVLASIGLAGLVGISLPVAELSGTPTKEWLRDTAPYVLLAAAPFFALDAHAVVSKRLLELVLAVAGILGALAFAVQWLQRRNIATLGLEALGFPTVLLGAALFAYAMSATLRGGVRTLPWLAVGSLAFGLLLSTGTRTSLILLAAPLGIVFGSARQFARRSVRLAAFIPVAAVFIVLSTQSVLKAADADESIVRARVEAFLETGESSDRSYLDRLSQTEAAWDAFASAPITGIGLGAHISWDDSFGTRTTGLFIDSPLLFPAKFGLLGLAWLTFFVGAFVAFVARLGRASADPTVSHLALIGFGLTVAAFSILLVPFTDKGFSAAIVLLVAIALREAFGGGRAVARP